MSTRKQLNTDILLHISAQAVIANVSLLEALSLSKAETKTAQDANDYFTSKLEELVGRSKELDRSGK